MVRRRREAPCRPGVHRAHRCGFHRRFGAATRTSAVGPRRRQAQRVERRGVAEQLALEAVAAVACEQVELVLGLHACGDRDQPQAVAQVDQGARDGGVARVARQAAYQRAVELDAAQRQAFQAGQRRGAGAVVVEREADAARAASSSGRRRRRSGAAARARSVRFRVGLRRRRCDRAVRAVAARNARRRIRARRH